MSEPRDLLDTGETDLPALVCLHALFLDAGSFDGLVAAGRGRFRFLRPTFPGQGHRTGGTTATVTMDDCVADTLALLADAGVARYALLGQSMGGDVAVRIAAAHPDDVTALVLVGSSARDEPAEQRAAFTGVVDHMANAGFDDMIQQTVLSIMLGATTRADPAQQDLVADFKARFAALPAELSHAARGVVERPDATGLLADITAPTLVVNGTDDVARPPAWSADVAARITGARQVQLEGVGHSATQEAPDVVMPLVLDFVAEHA
ncbi:alpha/beta fold hydrolase [Nocardioides albidus]|uniref:Alpha/beta fold hydrolase n=1 Tax=Nocardioides albidus TaxID=1517589 RepID=A0A5C4VLH6_9ACTN|nr:alpha/beta hydrolase [Nocardioides albidus]TNM36189.1 alpha/beta fold hydrolase [Nocardioides albidus]